MPALLLRSTLRSGTDSVAAVLFALAAAAAAAADVGVAAGLGIPVKQQRKQATKSPDLAMLQRQHKSLIMTSVLTPLHNSCSLQSSTVMGTDC
jgi:hypothetical protein